jgi:hypothetical protein
MAELPISGTIDEAQDDWRPVAGEVRLMTEEPIPASEVDGSGGVYAAVCRQLGRRPWLIPLALILGITVIVGLRRRAD